MNCGTHANSDKMLLSARIVFPDGTMLDTGDKDSKTTFALQRPDFIARIKELRDKVRASEKLSQRIRHKYSIKNVTGLNILPFVLYDDPFDIITHLMVGSEGTLAFLSEVTMKTEYDFPYKASAMLYFQDIREACRAVVAMKEGPVMGAELLDRKSLESVNDPIGTGLTAVLTETKAHTKEELDANIREIERILDPFDTFIPVYFTDKEEEYSKYWAIRSGIFPSVGGTREPGTTSLIEDVAFHIKDLPEATARLQNLLIKHGYNDACIYGHALEGNYHFIINQAFDTPAKVKRYEDLMDDVIALVVDKYDGSLKAEHGTGRNMAPFVAYEWGEEAWEVMREVKELFDPKGLLNPGVIFNKDPKCHIKNFKPLPLIEFQSVANAHAVRTDSQVNKCIECGFCEVNCLTCGFTLSSRQRVVIQREISRLRTIPAEEQRLNTLIEQYKYQGNATCAGDGLCSMSCPMGINVGDLTHEIRQLEMPEGSLGYSIGKYAANHFHGIKNTLRPVLGLANAAHSVLGDKAMTGFASGLHKFCKLPLWTTSMPKPYRVNRRKLNISSANNPIVNEEIIPQRVVYFPSCINQLMGVSKHAAEQTPLVTKTVEFLSKSGYVVVFPKLMDSLCCGTIWESKGMPDIADRKAAELENALYEASEQGKYPVLCDQSPCLYRMRHTMTKVKLYEPVEFILLFLLNKLEFTPIDRPVAVHATCSMKKMGLDKKLVELARLCSTHVLEPEEVGCCGFAGDKGFTHPEVNAYALRKLKPQTDKNCIEVGYSNSRTCEIGLTTNTNVPYMSIIFLVDECTKLKAK